MKTRTDIFTDDDYGVFGKGTEGYIHYVEATKRNSGGGGGGGGGGGDGCFWKVLLVAALIYMVIQMVRCAGSL